MMPSLAVHPATEQNIKAFMKKPSQALLLSGLPGSGKGSLAALVAQELLSLPGNTLDAYPYFLNIEPEAGKALSIEQIRQLEHFLSLRVPQPTLINRVAIIQDGHTMTTEAQNALLKRLEEPPEGTTIIITAARPDALLPTIRSRMQHIHVTLPGADTVKAYFLALQYAPDSLDKAYVIAGGLPGLLQSLLDETEHPLLLATQTARQLLQQTLYERLLVVDEMAKQRELSYDTLFILSQMADISLKVSNEHNAARWRKILSAAYLAASALEESGQPKLVLTNLMVNLA
jgi:hypothetical protein